MTKNCKECKKSKSIDPIQEPLTLNCRNKDTRGWLCPEKGIPDWCQKKIKSKIQKEYRAEEKK